MTNRLKLGMIAVIMLVVSAVALKQRPVTEKSVENIEYTFTDLTTSNTINYPALVRLVMENGNTYCSASVIAANLVVTAAHCVAHQNMFGEFEVSKEVFIKSLPNKNNKTAMIKGALLGFNPRADYALIQGDFSKFKRLKYNDKPSSDILFNNYKLMTCGFPWGQAEVCYPFTNPLKAIDMIKGTGQLYAGMSGGPVIDVNTGTVYAVNSAVTDLYVIIAPIVGILGGR